MSAADAIDCSSREFEEQKLLRIFPVLTDRSKLFEGPVERSEGAFEKLSLLRNAVRPSIYDKLSCDETSIIMLSDL